MNSIKNNIAKIDLKEQVLDLQPIYTVGREVAKHDNKVNFLNLEKLKIDDNRKQELKRMVKHLLSIIQSSQAPFHPSFIELSLFDPADRTGDYYFSILIAENDQIIDCYKKQMKRNLQIKPNSRSNKADKEENRGPIIPNKKLHKSAYYSTSFDANQKKPLEFDEITIDKIVIEVGRFETSGTGLNFTHKKKYLDDQIENFLKDVGENCMSQINNHREEFVFNTALLIPLFRPAAIFKGELEYRLNGGGIFLFGNIEKPDKESDLVIELQSNLTKSIFKASYSQIAFDQIESFKNTFNSMFIHQLKNKLTNQISQKLSYLLKSYTINNKEAVELITQTKNSSENIVNKFSRYLDNIGFVLSEGNKQGTTFNEFLGIINDICVDNNIAFEYRKGKDVPGISAMIHPDGLKMILDEFVTNAINYYTNHNGSLKRKIIFKWVPHIDSGRLSLYTISNQTTFDEIKIKQYGLIPIMHTDSNGFGGYFINAFLEQVEVKRFPDGRYFQPENTKEGVSIKIEFKIK